MAITFPISPSTGQKFTNGNKVWTWNGNSWKGGITSGGDAGTIDSIDSGSFLRSDTNDSFSGTLSGAGSINITGTVTAASFTGSGAGLTNVNDSTKLPLAGGTMTGAFGLNNQKINFISGGGGTTFAANHYSMGIDIANGAWTGPNYSDLIIGYHTGIRIGAGYSGIRFYDNSPTTDANNDGNGDGVEELLMTIGGGGSPTSGSNVTVTNNLYVGGSVTAMYSDRRLKENINPITNALDKVDSLTGMLYTQNDLAASFGYKDKEQQVGVFAQDIQKVLPEAVKLAPFDTDSEGNSKSGENYLTVQYEKLVPLLIEAIKELRLEVKELKGL